MSQPYEEPVAGLTRFGREWAVSRQWPDYLTEFGLDATHVPELIRMALDPDFRFADIESVEIYSGIHAWRALGQLRAQEAVEPLLTLLDQADEWDDDWVLEELPRVFAMIGPPVVVPVAERLFDASRNLWTRVATSESLRRVAERHEAARDSAVEALATQLSRYQQNDPTLNGFLVTALSELKAVDRAPLIERAFSAGAVDVSVMGDWEDAQIELGLLEKRTTPRPEFGYFAAPDPHAPPETALEGHRSHAAKSKHKVHRKMAKASRRRNRRKGK